MSSVVSEITNSVRNLYEAFPYPSYPLWAALQWQDGYAATSDFAGALFFQNTGFKPAIHLPKNMLDPQFKTVLIAGSGETLPYIIRKLEPSRHRVLALDLSEKSLSRARKRLWGRTIKRTQFVQGDINEYLKNFGNVTGPYEHIDAYGVLHHLPNPSHAVRIISEKMHRFGTIRLMFYNTNARQWIHHLQHAFRMLGLKSTNRSHLEDARRIIAIMARQNASFRRALLAMGSEQIENNCRFVDTFFHPREARLQVREWYDSFEAAGLRVIGMLDRHGQLDDLPNPLWMPPSLDQLEERIRNGQLTENFEVYLAKNQDEVSAKIQSNQTISANRKGASLMKFRSAPSRWFVYPETQGIPAKLRRTIWHSHCEYVYQGREVQLDAIVRSMSHSCRQRLCRIGAVLAHQIKDHNLRTELAVKPLIEETNFPDPVEVSGISFRASPLSEELMNVLQKTGNFSERRFNAVVMRCEASVIAASSI